MFNRYEKGAILQRLSWLVKHPMPSVSHWTTLKVGQSQDPINVVLWSLTERGIQQKDKFYYQDNESEVCFFCRFNSIASSSSCDCDVRYLLFSLDGAALESTCHPFISLFVGCTLTIRKTVDSWILDAVRVNTCKRLPTTSPVTQQTSKLNSELWDLKRQPQSSSEKFKAFESCDEPEQTQRYRPSLHFSRAPPAVKEFYF